MWQRLRQFGVGRAIAAAVVVGGGGATAYQAARPGTAVAAAATPVPPVPAVVAGAGETEVLGTLTGDVGRRDGGAIVLRQGEQVHSADVYAVPVTVHVLAFTAGSSLQMAVGNAWVAFSRGPDGERLTVRVTGDRRPARAAAVPFPGGRWADVAVRVDRRQITVAVDGMERYAGAGDFSRINGPVTIYSADELPVRVGSVRVAIGAGTVEPRNGAGR